MISRIVPDDVHHLPALRSDIPIQVLNMRFRDGLGPNAGEQIHLTLNSLFDLDQGAGAEVVTK
jgi:hypothetical protein